ncbi:MAG: serine hydrolase domain-containing protein [Anaeromyxobacter sp.]
MTPVLATVSGVLERARADGVAPALSAAVFARGRLVHASWHGEVPVPGARALARDDLFDVASLTKVMATATLAAQLADAGALDLDAPVAAALPGFERGGKEPVTARHLLAHASGLPALRPYHAAAAADPSARACFLPPGPRPPFVSLAGPFAAGKALVRAAVLAEPLEAAPSSRAVYSDVGFLALGFLVEALGGDLLSRLAARRVFGPLGLTSTAFVDGLDAGAAHAAYAGRAFAPTGWSEARGGISQGLVNDDNAWAVGGGAGHAGVFSTAQEVAALGQAWLDALAGGRSPVPADAAREFVRRDAVTPGSGRALGWDTPTGESSIGSRLGRGPKGAVGHLGYTGCSLWLDLDAEVAVAVLTNHVHPGGKADRPRMLAFRRAVHDAVADGLSIG